VIAVAATEVFDMEYVLEIFLLLSTGVLCIVIPHKCGVDYSCYTAHSFFIGI
jgi:hypothetical protein